MESMETAYFESYEDLNVHKLMLEDIPRNKAYREAILGNRDNIENKVVLDVGAGTGILSIFCAQAGARTVYAVEASKIFKVAERIVKENNFENVVKVIHGKVEEITLPEDVDVIVSEWMGFYLLHESMINSVIIARDRFLKAGGIMFPESATLYSAPCSVPLMYDFWNNVEGVSMSSFAKKLKEVCCKEPITETVYPDCILSDSEVVLWIDLREVTSEDIKSIDLRHVAVANKIGKYQGVCLWFSCTFPSTTTEPVVLITDPDEPSTHWKQTTIVLPAESELQVEPGTPIAYDLSFKQSPDNSRRYTIQVTMLDPGEVEHPEYCLCHMTKCILVRAMLEKYEKDDVNRAENE